MFPLSRALKKYITASTGKMRESNFQTNRRSALASVVTCTEARCVSPSADSVTVRFSSLGVTVVVSLTSILAGVETELGAGVEAFEQIG